MKSRTVHRLRVIRYALLIGAVIFLIMVIRARINNTSVTQEITRGRTETSHLDTQRHFLNTFYLPYLNSDIARTYDLHAHHLAHDDEIVIKITPPPLPENDTTNQPIYTEDLTPQQSRQLLFDQMLRTFIHRVST